VKRLPIISFSINENLKKFLNKLASKKSAPNQSMIMRNALLQLMSTMETSEIDTDMSIFESPKSIIGNVMMVVENDDEATSKKIIKLELDHGNSIVGKSQYIYTEYRTILLVFEGKLGEFQKFITEINGIENLKNFRYVIIN
jgi:metal-responsive CopG/Arc/MetJ family transcriptional regulator